MAKQLWKPGNLLAPVPAVLVTVKDLQGRENVLTLAWAGTICSDPVMVSISVRKERFSHQMLMESKEFVMNLTTKALLRATDYCGVKSGRDENKFEKAHLHLEKAQKVRPSLIQESPINLECKVEQVLELGSHDLFIARVVAVDVDEKLLDPKGKLCLEKAGLIAFVHGAYMELGKVLGTFGYSIRKKI